MASIYTRGTRLWCRVLDRDTGKWLSQPTSYGVGNEAVAQLYADTIQAKLDDASLETRRALDARLDALRRLSFRRLPRGLYGNSFPAAKIGSEVFDCVGLGDGDFCLCHWCGAQFGIDITVEGIRSHIATCQHHPMAMSWNERASFERRRQDDAKELGELRASLAKTRRALNRALGLVRGAPGLPPKIRSVARLLRLDDRKLDKAIKAKTTRLREKFGILNLDEGHAIRALILRGAAVETRKGKGKV